MITDVSDLLAYLTRECLSQEQTCSRRCLIFGPMELPYHAVRRRVWRVIAKPPHGYLIVSATPLVDSVYRCMHIAAESVGQAVQIDVSLRKGDITSDILSGFSLRTVGNIGYWFT